MPNGFSQRVERPLEDVRAVERPANLAREYEVVIGPGRSTTKSLLELGRAVSAERRDRG
jgi:hypothetical protein